MIIGKKVLEERMKAVVERITAGKAFLELSGKSVECGLTLLPSGVNEGDCLEISIRIDKVGRKKREAEAISLQKKLSGKK